MEGADPFFFFMLLHHGEREDRRLQRRRRAGRRPDRPFRPSIGELFVGFVVYLLSLGVELGGSLLARLVKAKVAMKMPRYVRLMT